MPEGHTVHRTAIEFRKHFVGQPISVSSPQGRFAASAAELSGQNLESATAIGKQLFLGFEAGTMVRVHLGIYGKWRFESFEGTPPNPIGQVRARFLSSARLADLRGPTACELLHQEQVRVALEEAGPDPLGVEIHTDALRFVSNVRKSRSSIALLLMNQKVISGVGNVYRAELLFRANLNPHRRGCDLSQDELLAMWDDAVRLMKVGVKKGVMITRDELLVGRVPVKSERNFVYQRTGEPCRVCGEKIIQELLAARKLYWCPSCQR